MNDTEQRQAGVELGFLEGLSRRMPDHVPLLETLGHLYTKAGRYRDGLNMDLKLTELKPEIPLYWYNLGCSYSLLDNVDPALNALEKAIALGYRDVEWMRKDGDLDHIRKHPRFRELMERAMKAGHQDS